MKDVKTKVIFQIEKTQFEGEGNVKSMFTITSDAETAQDLIKAFITTGIQNPHFGEVLKYAVNALKKAETPLKAPTQYQA